MKRTLILSWTNGLAWLSVTAMGVASCTLDEVCQNGEMMCVVCPQDQLSCDEGVAIRNEYYSDSCALYKCSNGAFAPEEMLCSNGFNGKHCVDECIDGEMRCVPRDETENPSDCIVQECKQYQNPWKQWDKTGTSCDNGFNIKDKSCYDECSAGIVGCDELSEEEYSSELYNNKSCRIKTCTDEGKWAPQNDICLNGFDSEKGVCEESECKTLGELNPDDDKEICVKNEYNEWKYVYKRCPFGFKNDSDECNDPCNISERINGKKIVVRTVENGETVEHVFECGPNGWNESGCGDVDFNAFDGELTDCDNNDCEKNLFIQYLSPDLSDKKQLYENGKIYYGTCGTCSREMSPDYYTVNQDDGCILHACENGQVEISPNPDDKTCNKIVSKIGLKSCYDNSGNAIYVDTKTNPYHCGDCNHVCGNNERCVDGSCKSSYECEPGEYVKINIGTRWVKAYCVKDFETLVEIRNAVSEGSVYPNGQNGAEKNYDNAYILGDDIAVDEEAWLPIGTDEKHAFSGVFFGNNHAIAMGKIKTAEYMGLFGYVKNAVIQALNISLISNDYEIALSSGKQFAYFGLLAGFVKDSVVQSVSVGSVSDELRCELKLSKDAFVNSSGVCREDSEVTRYRVGGLIGQIEAQDVDAVVSHSSLGKIQFKLNYGQNDECIGVGERTLSVVTLGGLIGRSEPVDGHQIQLQGCSIESVNITEEMSKNGRFVSVYAGGGMGSANNHMVIDDFVIKRVEGKFKSIAYRHELGGIAGALEGATISNARIGAVDIHVAMDGSRNRLGGAVGTMGDGSLISGVDICDVNAALGESGCSLKGTRYVGGLAGYAYNNCIVSDVRVHIDDIGEFDNKRVTGYHYLSGLVGRASSLHVEESTVKVNQIWGYAAIGGVIGESDSQTIVSRSNVRIGTMDGNGSIGGLIGIAKETNVNDCNVEYDNVITENVNSGIEGADQYRLSEFPNCLLHNDTGQTVWYCCVIGGLIGRANNVNIVRSHAMGKSIKGLYNTGAMIGDVQGNFVSIENSSAAIGKIVGYSSVGGLIGLVQDKINVNLNRVMSVFNLDVYRSSGSSYIGVNKASLVTADTVSLIGTVNCNENSQYCDQFKFKPMEKYKFSIATAGNGMNYEMETYNRICGRSDDNLVSLGGTLKCKSLKDGVCTLWDQQTVTMNQTVCTKIKIENDTVNKCDEYLCDELVCSDDYECTCFYNRIAVSDVTYSCKECDKGQCDYMDNCVYDEISYKCMDGEMHANDNVVCKLGKTYQKYVYAPCMVAFDNGDSEVFYCGAYVCNKYSAQLCSYDRLMLDANKCSRSCDYQYKCGSYYCNVFNISADHRSGLCKSKDSGEVVTIENPELCEPCKCYKGLGPIRSSRSSDFYSAYDYRCGGDEAMCKAWELDETDRCSVNELKAFWRDASVDLDHPIVQALFDKHKALAIPIHADVIVGDENQDGGNYDVKPLFCRESYRR